jgi:glutamate racemase
MDSGVGGLTLVRELVKLCPGEDIVYLGDSANCPYGNRAQEDIFALALSMLRFLQQKGSKVAAIACNTISALAEPLALQVDIPLLGIVSPVAEAVTQSGLDQVGVFATEFTISTQIYTRLIQAHNPRLKIYGKGSHLLASLVDSGASEARIEEEIKTELGALLAHEPLDHVILGCTHFPIVEDIFQRCFPDVTFLNPAKEQAKAVISFLREPQTANHQEKGRLSIYTSGNAEPYRSVLARLGITECCDIATVSL